MGGSSWLVPLGRFRLGGSSWLVPLGRGVFLGYLRVFSFSQRVDNYLFFQFNGFNAD